jgi:hypothetical protein
MWTRQQQANESAANINGVVASILCIIFGNRVYLVVAHVERTEILILIIYTRFKYASVYSLYVRRVTESAYIIPCWSV